MKNQEEKSKANKPVEEENINKIRDILFGNNISEFEKRFQQLEADFRQQTEKLQEELQNKVTHLQTHFQNEVNNLVAQLKKEQEENKKSFDELLKKNENQVDDLKNYKNEVAETHREIRATQLEQFNKLQQDLSNTEKEIKNLLSDNTTKLTDNKVDRKTLALLLSEIAIKLNDDDETTS